MGAWGTSLYANDSACDVRGDYVDKLRRGKSNEEALQEILEANRDSIGDEDEEALLWYALADTLWNYGRLVPFVKEKALYFLEHGEEDERWREAGEKKLNAWRQTLEKLKKKLNTPQPPEKKVYRYRLYHCQWQLGDVFAYRLTGTYSVEHGYAGKYIVFRKVSETNWWPGHTIPVVQAYKRIFDQPPALEELEGIPLLEIDAYATILETKPQWKIGYHFKLITESARVIPQDSLTLLGNISDEALIPFEMTKKWQWLSIPCINWEGAKGNEHIEEYVLTMYESWKDVTRR